MGPSLGPWAAHCEPHWGPQPWPLLPSMPHSQQPQAGHEQLPRAAGPHQSQTIWPGTLRAWPTVHPHHTLGPSTIRG